jgi:hypothetical protein
MRTNTQEAFCPPTSCPSENEHRAKLLKTPLNCARLVTSLNRLNEITCNSGLTERRKQDLQTRIKAVLEGTGLVLNHFNNDPRGYAVYLDLPDGSYNSFGGRECGYGIGR